jgi:hypothetical protein
VDEAGGAWPSRELAVTELVEMVVLEACSKKTRLAEEVLGGQSLEIQILGAH